MDSRVPHDPWKTTEALYIALHARPPLAIQRLRRYLEMMRDRNSRANALHLGWVGEPASVVGLVQTKPDSRQHPQIVGRYDITPPEPKKADTPRLFCTHCQSHTHWKGYVLADECGQHYLIGSACGPKHYGAERFSQARKEFRAIESRAILRRRAQHISSYAATVADEVRSLLSHDDLAAIARASGDIRRASPDMFARLTSHIATGEPLKTVVMVRGKRHKPEPALRSIGSLEGAAVIKCDVKDAAAAVVLALDTLAAIELEAWDIGNPIDLQKPILAIERAAKDLIDARRVAMSAHKFFSAANRRRLAKWSRPLHRFLSISDEGQASILISDVRVNIGPVEITPLARALLPRLRACELLLKES